MMPDWYRCGALAALALASNPARAAPGDVAGARDHVAAIYRRIPGRFDYASVRYDRELAELIRRDAAFSRASGEVGALDSVPFCDCQDTDPNYRVLRVAATPQPGGVTRVDVDLRNGAMRRFVVELVMRDGKWVVRDIHSRAMPSLLARMRREVPREERALRAMSAR